MERRNISVSLEEAKKWYNSNNQALKELALKTFTEDELKSSVFSDIKTFEDALEALNLSAKEQIIIFGIIEDIEEFSKASAAMFKLNIIRKALNLGQDLHLTKDPEHSCIYYPYNPFITKSSTYYDGEINSDKMEVIGKIENEGEEYYVLGGYANTGGNTGLGYFSSNNGVGYARADFGFLGCANKEIAQHFGKYFGMLIIEAKYGDMVDFEIIETVYKN